MCLCILSVILYSCLNLAMHNGQNMSQWGIDQNAELLLRLCYLLCLQAFVPGVSIYETKCLSEIWVIYRFFISLEVHTCWRVNLSKEQRSRSVNDWSKGCLYPLHCVSEVCCNILHTVLDIMSHWMCWLRTQWQWMMLKHYSKIQNTMASQWWYPESHSTWWALSFVVISILQ